MESVNDNEQPTMDRRTQKMEAEENGDDMRMNKKETGKQQTPSHIHSRKEIDIKYLKTMSWSHSGFASPSTTSR